jgi:ankyrin repeat protein
MFTVSEAARFLELVISIGLSEIACLDILQNGATPLFIAAEKGRKGCVKLLLDANAAVDAARNVGGSLAKVED